MIRWFRRHEEGCSLKGEAGRKCPKRKNGSFLQCPVYVAGSLRNGTPIKKQSLNTRSIPLPEEIAAWELGHPIGQPVDPNVAPGAPQPHAIAKTLLTEASEIYLLKKNKRSLDRQRKLRLMLKRLIDYCAAHGILYVQDITLPFLVRYVATWTSSNGTQKTDQENLRGFFRFCVDSDWISKSPAKGLETIADGNDQTEVFTHEELLSIFESVSKLAEQYGEAIALQIEAFALVMRYTGLSIGDVAGLPKTHVVGDRIKVNVIDQEGGTRHSISTERAKTGKEVYVTVPAFVIRKLNAAPHDSEKYYFWSGNGLIHTRTSKWGERLQRLFVTATVRLVETEWTNKSTRSAKAKELSLTTKRIISEADPRWFRHTLARDLLNEGIVTMEELAEILGNSLAVCVHHYSKWDTRRQNKIDSKMKEFWATDPLMQKLAAKVVS